MKCSAMISQRRSGDKSVIFSQAGRNLEYRIMTWDRFRELGTQQFISSPVTSQDHFVMPVHQPLYDRHIPGCMSESPVQGTNKYFLCMINGFGQEYTIILISSTVRQFRNLQENYKIRTFYHDPAPIRTPMSQYQARRSGRQCLPVRTHLSCSGC